MVTEIKLCFETIDYWGRAIFKVEGRNLYVTNVDKLFYGESKEEIVEYFKAHKDQIVIHGDEIDGDPLGVPIKKSINIIIE